jgi:hypothetical protein
MLPDTMQVVRSGGHTEMQRPREHICPEGQAVPHAPQLALSRLVLTHALPQSICPVGHAQVPIVQLCPIAHARPHMPQLDVSALMSTQAPGPVAPRQSVCPMVHTRWQRPVLHT